MGKAIGKVGGAVLKPLTSGPLGDMLFGKEDPGVAASQVNIYTPEQQKLLGDVTTQYGDLLKQNNNMAANQSAMLENQARATGDDQERLARQEVAKRGMGNSSIGLNAIMGAREGVGDKVGAIRANAQGMQLQNLNNINSGIGNLLGTQSQGTIYNKAQASQGRLPGGIGSTLIEGYKASQTGGKSGGAA